MEKERLEKERKKQEEEEERQRKLASQPKVKKVSLALSNLGLGDSGAVRASREMD
jgi:hypothetical protein